MDVSAIGTGRKRPGVEGNRGSIYVLSYEGPELDGQRALPFPSFVGILHAVHQAISSRQPLGPSVLPSSSALLPLQALAALEAPGGRKFLATLSCFLPPSYLSSLSPSLIFIF